MPRQVTCPRCRETKRIIRNGRSHNKSRQMYRCLECKTRFTEFDTYLRHRFPADVIKAALEMVHNGISYRGVVTLLEQQMETRVSATTIYRWHKKFG